MRQMPQHSIKTNKTEMQAQEKIFLDNYRRYNEFRRHNIVPPKIEMKLEYLGKAILNDTNVSPEIRKSLTMDQLDALDMLDHYTKLRLFISISDCILGNNAPHEAVQAHIRYDKYFSFWKLCYITYDAKNLYITTEKKQAVPMSFIHVLRQPRKKDEKFVIALEINGDKAFISFSKERHAQKLCKVLADPNRQLTFNSPMSLLQHSQSTVVKMNDKLTSMCQVVLEEQTVVNNNNGESESFKSVGEASRETIRLPSLTALQKQMSDQFQLDGVMSDQGYRIDQVLRNGRILFNQTNPQQCKLFMTLECSRVHNIIIDLTNIVQWNCNVVESKIITKVQPNNYIYYERVKYGGITSRDRDFVFLRQGIKINNHIHLLDRSVEHANFPAGTYVYRGSIHKRTISLIPHPQNARLTLLVCIQDIDFGCGSTGNRDFSQRILKNFSSLNLLLDQHQFVGVDLLYNFDKMKEHAPKLSNRKSLQVTPVNTKISVGKEISEMQYGSELNSTPVIMTSQKDSILQSQQLSELKVQSSETTNHTQPKKTLVDVGPLYETDLITPDYLEFVEKDKQHLTMYLKHRYSMEDRSVATKLHPNEEGLNNFIFQGGEWKINDSKDFIFTNQTIIDSQKDVVRWVLKRIGTNFISGKSVMNISLPVDIFQGRGLLERSAGSFGYAPVFLEDAGKTNDLVEQMKLVTTFLISIANLELRSEKPFNPILGETFQGYLGNTPIYYQQISHHPPISAYYMKNETYEMYGNVVSFADLGLNSAVGGNAGIMHIKFLKNGRHYECSLPGCQISGMIFGERRVRQLGKAFVLNQTDGMFSQISFGKDKKGMYPSQYKMESSDIAGGIFRVNSSFVDKYLKFKTKYKFEGVSQKDIQQKLSTLDGNWTSNIEFDSKIYKRLLGPAPYQVEYQKCPLPSNSNFRLDVIHKRMGNVAKAQNAKQELENLQRADKNLRKCKS